MSLDASELFGYSVTSRWFTTLAGARMHYLDEGPREAPVVVFVHGNPTWSFAWRHLIAKLKNTHRCIAMDHIGMGLSDKPEDYPYTLPRRVRDLSDLLDSLNIDKASLIVHDWGGMIGMSHAVANPDRFDRFVVMNTAAFPLPLNRSFMWQLVCCRLPIAGDFLVRGLNGFCTYAITNCAKRQKLSPAAIKGYLAPHDDWANRVAVHQFVKDIPLIPSDPGFQFVSNVDKQLHKLADKPMLLPWGLKDFVFDHHFLTGWRERFPNAEVHEFADCGHYLFEDAQTELDLLIPEFLNK